MFVKFVGSNYQLMDGSRLIDTFSDILLLLCPFGSSVLIDVNLLALWFVKNLAKLVSVDVRSVLLFGWVSLVSSLGLQILGGLKIIG
jgi:hypothetical protein